MTLNQIVSHFGGSIESAAYLLNISRQTLYNWQKTGVPLVRQQAIETVSQGALKADKRRKKK